MTKENKYKEGEVVYERTNPTRKLIIGRYLDGLYYCKLHESQKQKALVYFERELIHNLI